MDGQILDNSLAEAKMTRQWLEIELEKLGVTLDNVFLGQVDSYGQLTVDVYDDKINVPSPQEKPLLISMIKKGQADLETFALQTDAKDAKKMFIENSKKLQEVIDVLTPYLKG
jgi:23S rRNA G2069 N7-methylase RlmK/C1962 C5-methylase RlmI